MRGVIVVLLRIRCSTGKHLFSVLGSTSKNNSVSCRECAGDGGVK